MHSYTDNKKIVTVAFTIYSMVMILSFGACSKTSGNPENGRRWYSMNNCSSCHGDKGNNGMAPDIAGLEMGFGSFLKNLRKPNSVAKPIYQETDISRQDAVDMYVWLKGNLQ